MTDDGITSVSAKEDADLTNMSVVSDLNDLQVWVKLPPLKADWRHIDLKALFEAKPA